MKENKILTLQQCKDQGIYYWEYYKEGVYSYKLDGKETLIENGAIKGRNRREIKIYLLNDFDIEIVEECELMEGNENPITYRDLMNDWNMFTTETLEMFIENLDEYVKEYEDNKE